MLQPAARKIRRRHLELLEWVEQLAGEAVEQRALAVAWFARLRRASPPADLVRGAGVGPDEAAAADRPPPAAGRLADVSIGPARRLAAPRRPASANWKSGLLGVVGRTARSRIPLVTAHDRQKVAGATRLRRRRHPGPRGRRPAHRARSSLVGDRRRVARADFKPKLSVNQRKLKDKIVAAHREAGFQPPEPASFANQAAGNAASLNDIFEVAVAEGIWSGSPTTCYLHADARRRDAAAGDGPAGRAGGRG